MSDTDIKLAIKANVDMIGFVFYEPSPRSLTIDRAANLMKNIPRNILLTLFFPMRQQFCSFDFR